MKFKLLLVASVCALTACGGGGGSSHSSNNSSSPATVDNSTVTTPLTSTQQALTYPGFMLLVQLPTQHIYTLSQ
jgi:hypothetical protein